MRSFFVDAIDCSLFRNFTLILDVFLLKLFEIEIDKNFHLIRSAIFYYSVKKRSEIECLKFHRLVRV